MNTLAPAPAVTVAALSLPGVRHGFFTRRGGMSQGLYESNNVAYGAKDETAHVTRNRAACAARLGLANLVTLQQRHTADVVTVDTVWEWTDAPVADAMVTRRTGIALGILTADCGPVLFADPDAGVVGAAHAGWRGAFDGVLAHTVAAMTALGANPARITAALGPCIAQASYEVGAEFVERFTARDPSYATLFAASPKPGHAHFDLTAFIVRALRACGVGTVTVEGSDTCAAEDQFFSYRRATLRGEPDYGRQLSAIGLL